MKNILCIAIIILSFSTCFSQGRIDGFYRGNENLSLVLGGGFEDSQAYFAGTDKIDLSRDIYYTSLFAVYGISDNLDVSIAIPFITSRNESSFQDISVFSKYRFYNHQFSNSKLQISFAAGFSTNIGDYNIGTLYDIGQKASFLETRAVLHYKHFSGWFSTIQSGFSYKLEEVPNSFPLVFKVGIA